MLLIQRKERGAERLPAAGFEDYVFVTPAGRGRLRCYYFRRIARFSGHLQCKERGKNLILSRVTG